MLKPMTAMRTGYQLALRSAIVLIVITNAIVVTVLTDLSLFRTTPLLFTLIITGIIIGSGLMIRDRYYLPGLRNLRIQGKLLLAPLMLLALTAPAAVIYIYHDLTGRESLLLLSGLLTSSGAAFYLSAMAVITLPSMGSVLSLSATDGWRFFRRSEVDPWQIIITLSVVLAVLLVVVSRLTGISASDAVYFLPVAAIAMAGLNIIIVAGFRSRLTGLLAGESATDEGGVVSQVPPVASAVSAVSAVPGSPAASAVLTTQWPTATPAGSAGSAGSAAAAANPTPAGSAVPAGHPGSSTQTPPKEQDILKLIGDQNPETRRTGILAAGRYEMTGLKLEILKALASPETARDACNTLMKFGPEVYGDNIGSVIKPGSSDRENRIILKLLDAMPLSGALPWLSNFVETGNMAIRLKAAGSLCMRGWKPQGPQRQKISVTVGDTLHTLARIIALHQEAVKGRSFLLTAALENEREMCTDLLRLLITLLTGRMAAGAIIPVQGAEDPYHAGIASEVIDSVIEDPVRQPLKAMFGNNTDRARLAELSLYFPVRSVNNRSLSSFLLATEQNITGTWTKACALHKAATERKGLDREQAVSYLFSNSQILQEESAAAIRSISPEWYGEAESRLQEPARSRISSVIRGTLPGTAMIFDKTRFLSLCFGKIPEEKMILLASGMRYSESYDTTSLPGVISWVVPSDNGKTGLYSLPVSDIADFVFYYSEFTDIFAKYTDNQGGLAVT